MITIQNNAPEQINSAILSLDGDISQMKQDVKEQMASLKSSVTTQAAGLTDGSTYNINIKGNAATADKVNSALTVSGTNSFTAASSTTYNGSAAKAVTIYTPDQEVNKTSSPTFAQITASYLFGSLNTYHGAHASFTTNIKAETSSAGKAGVLFVCTTQHSGSATSMGLGIGIITFPYSLGYDQSLNVRWLYADAAGTSYNQSKYWSFSLSSSQYLVATCSSTDGLCSITFL